MKHNNSYEYDNEPPAWLYALIGFTLCAVVYGVYLVIDMLKTLQ